MGVLLRFARRFLEPYGGHRHYVYHLTNIFNKKFKDRNQKILWNVVDHIEVKLWPNIQHNERGQILMMISQFWRF